MIRIVIACFKLFLLALAWIATYILQLVWLVLFSRTRFFYIPAIFFHSCVCLIFNIKVKVEGDIATGHVIYAGNHVSYMDIPVLGSFLKATFISKAEVKSWPLFGWLATIAETIFIKRTRNAAQECIDEIGKMLDRNRSLILFPEGTSSNGKDILPFKSSLFELFLNDHLKNRLAIQPFTISITETNGKTPETQNDRDLYAWHGDMDFGPHMWKMALEKGVKVTVTFHAPLAASHYTNRKTFAKECEDSVTSLQK